MKRLFAPFVSGSSGALRVYVIPKIARRLDYNNGGDSKKILQIALLLYMFKATTNV